MSNIRKFKPFDPKNGESPRQPATGLTPASEIHTDKAVIKPDVLTDGMFEIPQEQSNDGANTHSNVVSIGQPVSLANRKYELMRIRQQLDEELARIDADLKNQLDSGEVVFSDYGVGYRMTVASQDVYDRRVIRELSRMKLLPKFVRVSTTRLRELVTEGRLSEKKFNKLREYATPKEIATLREVPLQATTQTG